MPDPCPNCGRPMGRYEPRCLPCFVARLAGIPVERRDPPPEPRSHVVTVLGPDNEEVEVED